MPEKIWRLPYTAAQIEASVGKAPIIKDGTWWTWNMSTLSYQDTGVLLAADRFSNPNLLDNWYFADPINQRGQREYTFSYAYCIDRWILQKNTNCSMSVDDGYTTIHAQNADGISQNFEAGFLKYGETYTISILTLEGALLSDSFVMEETVQVKKYPGSNEWFFAYGKTAAAIDSIYLIMTYDQPEQRTIKPIAAKLELGSHQTLAHKEGDTWVLNDPPPNRALELAKCQRYLVAYHSGEIQNASIFLGVGVLDGYDADGNTPAQGYIALPCHMRTTPTIVGSLNVYNSIANAPIKQTHILGVTGNVLRFNFSVTGQVPLEERMCVIWAAGDFFITADL